MYKKKPEEIYIVNLFTVWDQRNNTEKAFHFIYPYIVWTLYNNHALLLKLTEEISRFKSQLGKMNLKVKAKLTFIQKKKKKWSLFFGEWVLIMERRKRPMPQVTWDNQTLSCTLSLSQERIPTSTSYLDGWQHLSNPQVPWGTEPPRTLKDQPFSLRFSMGIGNIWG